MALFKGSAFSPSATLHSEASALECTPVMAALRQVKFNPTLWLAWRAARHSLRAVNAEQVPVRLEPAGRSPCACSLGVSFVSTSPRPPLESSDFLSFLTHLMGLSEWGVCEVGFAASDAPAPAGPCAAACCTATVRKADKPNARLETLRRCPFMFTSSRNFLNAENRKPHTASPPVGHRMGEMPWLR